jgi:P27 family predicted phage terminase small subunit
MAGRPPKPTNLHIIQGTFEKSRHSKRKDVAFTRLNKAPPAPEHLSYAAAEEWRRLAPILVGNGIMSALDTFALERLCDTLVEIQELRAIIAKNGHTYGNGDLLKANPAVAMLSDADRRLLSWLTQFGLTPSSRTKITPLPEAKPVNPIDRFLG